MSDLNSIDNDLITVKKSVYDPCKFVVTNPQLHPESQDYAACSFHLNSQLIEHRKAKITPKKTGQFVRIWKRNAIGITTPFELSDAFNFIIITTKSENNLGKFLLPKKILASKGILSQNGKMGKRGIRVYPPWDSPISKQALQTQRWQSAYFLPISTVIATDFELAKKLLGAN